jgi:hypothetical protein
MDTLRTLGRGGLPCLKPMSEEKVKFILAGAYALTIQGYPRHSNRCR